MSVLKVGKNCCGCKSCFNVCGFGALSLGKDKYGFESVGVDGKLCVDCGLCEQVCPQINTAPAKSHIKCGWAYAVDDEVKESGSSGGLFGTVAKAVLADGGTVFGAAFDYNLQLKTAKAQNCDELVPLYKSKYLLCDTGESFSQIKQLLKSGKPVLYCSSPCQISALKLFLGKTYENLLTMEFICHGVASQALFDESVRYIEEKKNIKITGFTFRKKGMGPSSHYYSYKYVKGGKAGEKSGIYLTFPFYNAYCKEIAYREGCYTCKYASEKRCADITIGDFHTISKYDKTVDRFAGVSMFVINTEKGLEYWKKISSDIRQKEMSWEIIYKNNRFSAGDKIPARRKQFFDCFADKGFEAAVKNYLRPSRDIKSIVYYKMPSFVRNAVIKMKGEK